jgi:hypothetical protein
MGRSVRLTTCALVCAIAGAWHCGKKSETEGTPASTSPTPVPTPTASGPRFSFSYLGPAGITGDDASAVELPDGTLRVYFIKDGVRSVTSTNGTTFQEEAGLRQPCCPGQIRVLRTDGGWRLYNAAINAGTITSSFSTDGLSFTPEGRVHVTAGQVASGAISTGTFVRLGGGRLRMYFSTFPSTSPKVIYSATSSDGLSWTLDPGARTGPGTNISASAFHPTALSNSDGSVTLFYFVTEDRNIRYATATDGLTFGADTRAALPGFEHNDPDVVMLSSGRILLLTARVDGPPPRAATEYDVTEVTRVSGTSGTPTRIPGILMPARRPR